MNKPLQKCGGFCLADLPYSYLCKMKKIYFLSTCSTCARIIKELQLEKHGFVFQDIKTDKISTAQLQEVKNMAGSYEVLFSRVALKYKTLDSKPEKESEYQKLLLEEYTFLKRPVIINGNQIFIGNNKKVIEAAKASLH